MIEQGCAAKGCSRSCEEALDLDFFNMLVEKKKLESNVVSALESLRENQECCETADLFVQFPKYESLLSSLKSCSYVVRGTIYIYEACMMEILEILQNERNERSTNVFF